MATTEQLDVREFWVCPECGGFATSMMWGPECNRYESHERSAEQDAPRAVKCERREYVPMDALNEVGAECSRLEDDLLAIHDALEVDPNDYAINAEGIVEAIRHLKTQADERGRDRWLTRCSATTRSTSLIQATRAEPFVGALSPCSTQSGWATHGPTAAGAAGRACSKWRNGVAELVLPACTCDRERPETFDPACPEHGEGTPSYECREALARGDFDEYAGLLEKPAVTVRGADDRA